MTLATLSDVLQPALKGGYAVADIGVNAVSVLTGFEGR